MQTLPDEQSNQRLLQGQQRSQFKQERVTTRFHQTRTNTQNPAKGPQARGQTTELSRALQAREKANNPLVSPNKN